MGPFWVLACKAPITNRLNILVGGWRVFPKFNVKHLTPQAVVAPTCGGPATPDHLGGNLDAGSLSHVYRHTSVVTSHQVRRRLALPHGVNGDADS